MAAHASTLRRQIEALKASLDASNTEKQNAVTRAEVSAERLGRVEQQLMSTAHEADVLRAKQISEEHAHALELQAASAIEKNFRDDMALLRKDNATLETDLRILNGKFDNEVQTPGW